MRHSGVPKLQSVTYLACGEAMGSRFTGRYGLHLRERNSTATAVVALLIGGAVNYGKAQEARSDLSKLSPGLKRRLRTLALLLFSMHACHCVAAAQMSGLSEDQVKAGFMMNFLRFVQWPDRVYAARNAPVSICIVGDTSMSAVLTEAASGKKVDGHPIHVRFNRASDDLHTCHLVFVGAGDERHTAQVLEGLKGSSILTVGEFATFAKSGGMLNFYTEENKVKLEINLDAATHANLRISAKLIAVSHLISAKSVAKGL